jgi:hypothetical protein
MQVLIYGLLYKMVNMPHYTCQTLGQLGNGKSTVASKVVIPRLKALSWHDSGLNSTMYCTV